MNASGKVLTIFLVIIAVLLITLTGACIFFWNLEIEKRKEADAMVSRIGAKISQLETELAAAEKEKFLLADKNKEADERINNLLDEIDLEKGLREEMKLETQQLKEKVDAALGEKVKIQAEISNMEAKIQELEQKLKLELNRNEELTKRNQQLEVIRKKYETTTGQLMDAADSEKIHSASGSQDRGVRLQDIVVTSNIQNAKSVPSGKLEGRVLTVDEETNFVVIDVGEKQQVNKGSVFSVYRGDEYLGDIRITRVQTEMAAADLIPPLSSRTVRKNDQVIAK